MSVLVTLKEGVINHLSAAPVGENNEVVIMIESPAVAVGHFIHALVLRPVWITVFNSVLMVLPSTLIIVHPAGIPAASKFCKASCAFAEGIESTRAVASKSFFIFK